MSPPAVMLHTRLPVVGFQRAARLFQFADPPNSAVPSVLQSRVSIGFTLLANEGPTMLPVVASTRPSPWRLEPESVVNEPPTASRVPSGLRASVNTGPLASALKAVSFAPLVASNFA